MNIVILDLEWNGAYSRRLHGFINEIIEFGAVKLDAQLNITDRFSCFVKPQVTKKISAIISDLTNITDANLLDARPYMQVMSRFKKWAGDRTFLSKRHEIQGGKNSNSRRYFGSFFCH